MKLSLLKLSINWKMTISIKWISVKWSFSFFLSWISTLSYKFKYQLQICDAFRKCKSIRKKYLFFSDSTIISAGSSTGAFLGFEFLDGIWKLSSFDIKENAFSLCTFTSKIRNNTNKSKCVMWQPFRNIFKISATLKCYKQQQI